MYLFLQGRGLVQIGQGLTTYSPYTYMTMRTRTAKTPAITFHALVSLARPSLLVMVLFVSSLSSESRSWIVYLTSLAKAAWVAVDDMPLDADPRTQCCWAGWWRDFWLPTQNFVNRARIAPNIAKRGFFRIWFFLNTCYGFVYFLSSERCKGLWIL